MHVNVTLFCRPRKVQERRTFFRPRKVHECRAFFLEQKEQQFVLYLCVRFWRKQHTNLMHQHSTCVHSETWSRFYPWWCFSMKYLLISKCGYNNYRSAVTAPWYRMQKMVLLKNFYPMILPIFFAHFLARGLHCLAYTPLTRSSAPWSPGRGKPPDHCFFLFKSHPPQVKHYIHEWRTSGYTQNGILMYSEFHYCIYYNLCYGHYFW